jgi:hypothetical protein
MIGKFPLHPRFPERICWGCDKYCPADALGCGNGSDRTQHPSELLGDDWYLWGDWGIVPPGEGETPIAKDAPTVGFTAKNKPGNLG